MGSFSVQDKMKSIEKTVALLQAQLEVPRSAIPKLSAFNAIVEFVKETVPSEIRVSTDSPHIKGRGNYPGL